MEKETSKKKPVAKKNTKEKSSTKKTTTKSSETKKKTVKRTTPKSTIKKEEKPLVLNETVNLEAETVTVESKPELVMTECMHCHKEFEKGLTICPHCRKRQKSNIAVLFFIVFGCVFLLAIICFHFIDRYIIGENVNYKEDYKKNCVLVDFENLVRHPKDYKNKDVKVIGTVLSVDGYDSGFSNSMEITINANLFDNGVEQIMTISYNDKDYNQGFLVGDLITAYGKYTEINGNRPNIEAKYIAFGR